MEVQIATGVVQGSTLGNCDGAGLRALHQQVPHRQLRLHGGSKPSPTARTE